ncbi:MAG: hypothetical protein AAGA23_01035 [Pseudomonadota bacterium]
MSVAALLILAAAAAPAQPVWPEAPVVYAAASDLTSAQLVQTKLLRDGQRILSTNVRLACREALLRSPEFLAFDPRAGTCRGVSSTPVPVEGSLVVLEPPPLELVCVCPPDAFFIFLDGFEAATPQRF